MSETVVPIGVSNRHLHVAQDDLEALFGKGYQLTVKKDLSQKGQFAAEETVTLVGPKAAMANVRILGPCRERTQVEVSRTDCFQLGRNQQVRDSGDLDGSESIKIVGPKGEVTIPAGAILAKRHIHMTCEEAEKLGLCDRDIVMARTSGERALIFDEVLVRVHPTFTWEMHIDTDEANAASLKNGSLVTIIKKG